MSVPVRVILAGTLLIIIAMLVVGVGQIMLTPDFGQEVSRSDQQAIDRGCAKWRSITNQPLRDLSTQTFGNLMVSQGQRQIPLAQVCKSYFRGADETNAIRNCQRYCVRKS